MIPAADAADACREDRVRYRNESALVGAICRAVQAEHPDVWLLKSHGGPYQRAGIPDLLLCWNGLFIGMEVKHVKPGEGEQAARERTTPLQRSEIRKIHRAGGMAGTVISVEEALDMIRRAKDKAIASADGPTRSS